MDEKIKKRERLIQRDTVLKNKKIKKKKMEEKGLRGGLGKKRNGVYVQGLRGSEEGEEGSRVKMRRGAAEEEE